MPAHLKRKTAHDAPAPAANERALVHTPTETSSQGHDEASESESESGPEPTSALEQDPQTHLNQDPQEQQEDEEDEEQQQQQEEHSLSDTHHDAHPDQALSDRQARFRALQARQAQSRTSNRKETALESQRKSTDPTALTALARKRDVALQKLQRDDAAADSHDYERKRAWDWTIDEAERWDRRMAKKDKHRADVAFQDYRAEARKTYKRQMRDFKPDLDAYARDKADAVRQAARAEGLELVERDDGSIVAVDADGQLVQSFALDGGGDAAAVGMAPGSKPEKARVDALVEDLRKAEQVRLRKRKERGRQEDDGDITYINDKNKQFNQKLARFYNKYTADIRDSFERGTAI